MTVAGIPSRALAAALLLAGVLLVGFSTTGPLFAEIKRSQSGLHDELLRLARFQGLVDDRAAIESAYSSTENYTAHVYTEPNPSSMLAALQRDVSHLVADAGLRANAIRPVETRTLDDAAYVPLQLRIELSGSLDQLSEFCQMAHGHRRMLALDKVTVRAVRPGTDQAPAELTIALLLSAYGQVPDA